MYAIHVDVPEGATTLDVSLEYLAPTGGSSNDPNTSSQLAVLEWNLITLFPKGSDAAKITVEPSGKWTIAAVFNRKETVKQSGELDKKQLADLAKELARYDLRSLPGEGRPGGANPHLVTVAFDKRSARLVLWVGAPLPPADAATVPGRFGGIVRAVASIASAEKKR